MQQGRLPMITCERSRREVRNFDPACTAVDRAAVEAGSSEDRVHLLRVAAPHEVPLGERLRLRSEVVCIALVDIEWAEWTPGSRAECLAPENLVGQEQRCIVQRDGVGFYQDGDSTGEQGRRQRRSRSRVELQWLRKASLRERRKDGGTLVLFRRHSSDRARCPVGAPLKNLPPTPASTGRSPWARVPRPDAGWVDTVLDLASRT